MAHLIKVCKCGVPFCMNTVLLYCSMNVQLCMSVQLVCRLGCPPLCSAVDKLSQKQFIAWWRPVLWPLRWRMGCFSKGWLHTVHLLDLHGFHWHPNSMNSKCSLVHNCYYVWLCLGYWEASPTLANCWCRSCMLAWLCGLATYWIFMCEVKQFCKDVTPAASHVWVEAYAAYSVMLCIGSKDCQSGARYMMLDLPRELGIVW